MADKKQQDYITELGDLGASIPSKTGPSADREARRRKVREEFMAADKAEREREDRGRLFNALGKIGLGVAGLQSAKGDGYGLDFSDVEFADPSRAGERDRLRQDYESRLTGLDQEQAEERAKRAEDMAALRTRAGLVGQQAQLSRQQEQDAAKLAQNEIDNQLRDRAIKVQEGQLDAATAKRLQDLEKGKKKYANDKEQRQYEQALRKEYNGLQTTKDTNAIVVAYNKIQRAGEEPSAAGDIALIINYMKMLDPGSVVREGEFATAQNAGGVPDRIRAQYNKLVEGERLSVKQRDDFMKQAGGQFKAQLDAQQRVDSRFTDLATRAELDPEFIIESNWGGVVEKEPPSQDFPRTVRKGTQSATVSNAAEYQEALSEGWK